MQKGIKFNKNNMKNNGYSHLKTTKDVLSNCQQSTAIKSLRSIINETKIPLSNYINNQRSSIQKKANMTDKTRTKASYFQRFRGMIGNGYYEKIEEQSFITPNKFNNQCQNMEEQITFDEGKTLDAVNKSHLYRRTINHNDNSLRKPSRSISNNKRNSNLPKKYGNLGERPSFQPNKIIKTQQHTIITNKSNSMLPPKPLKNTTFMERKSNLRKTPNLQAFIDMSASSRGINTKSSNENLYPNFELLQPQQQKSLNQIIEHIHSHRRLNFCKQEERKQVIIYGKTFQKICENINFGIVKVISSTPIQIKEVLGNGAFSYVKVGSLKGHEMIQKFAIKIYQKYKLIEPGRKNRVMKEIQILSSLNHQNIAKLYCAFENKRQIHIVFEQIEESITLQQYFKHMSLKFSDSNMLIFIMKQILKGLEYLHSLGIAHRDLKPDNILISFKENFPIVKLIDFGFSTNALTSNIHCGTPNFMAPELFKKQSYSPIKADIWAFGVMLYFLIESKYPFKGYNEKDLIRNISQNRVKYQKTPNQIVQILNMIFQSNPQTRISSKDVLQLFSRFQ